MINNNLNNIQMWKPVYANSLDPWNPELWARESIAILEERMIFGALVHRDFNKEVSRFGDIVHTRKPAEFTAQQYAKGDTVTYQDASATDVQVLLDQIVDVSFLVYDVESSYSFADLITTYLEPAMLAAARRIDRKIAGQAAQFLGNTTGGMGTMSSTVVNGYIIDTEKKLNDQKVSDVNRNLAISSGTKAAMLKTDLFVSSERADTDNALRRARVGDLYGMDVMMSLNVPNASGATLGTATTTTGAILAGAATVPITADNVAVDQYFTLVGDATPLRCLSKAGSGPYTITFTARKNREAVASGAAVQPFAQGDVDLTAGYAAGWTKAIHVDGTGSPHVGQLVSFGTGTAEYIIVEATNTAGSDYDIVLDRALEASIANDVTANYGPNGSMNLAFQRNAITLVNRPLDLPRTGSGARVGVARSRNVAMRVALSWDQDTKAMKVSVDSLFGVKTLDTALGAVLLG
jgi:hypothetical protein